LSKGCNPHNSYAETSLAKPVNRRTPSVQWHRTDGVRDRLSSKERTGRQYTALRRYPDAPIARPSLFALAPRPREGMRGPLWLTPADRPSSSHRNTKAFPHSKDSSLGCPLGPGPQVLACMLAAAATLIDSRRGLSWAGAAMFNTLFTLIINKRSSSPM
jgi:hypothetical protein